jgi:hypothetical protein
LGVDSAPPVPGYLHWAPQWTHTAFVAFNRFWELVFQGSIMAILPVRYDDPNLASAKWLAFATPEEHESTGRWWDRQFSAGYLPVVGLDNSEFRGVLRGQGWL